MANQLENMIKLLHLMMDNRLAQGQSDELHPVTPSTIGKCGQLDHFPPVDDASDHVDCLLIENAHLLLSMRREENKLVLIGRGENLHEMIIVKVDVGKVCSIMVTEQVIQKFFRIRRTTQIGQMKIETLLQLRWS